MDEKKANLYHVGFDIHLQGRLIQFASLSYNELVSAAIDQERMMKAIAKVEEKKWKKMIPGSASSGCSSGAPPKYPMVYIPPGVSYVGHNSSRIGAIAHNSNCGNFSSNNHNNSSSSNSSMVLLPHRHSRLPLGRHNNLPPVAFPTSTVGRWATLFENATNQSKATHHELRHQWSTSRGAIRRVLCHGLAAPTTPPWKTFPREKKC
jgi:hypothetical protein